MPGTFRDFRMQADVIADPSVAVPAVKGAAGLVALAVFGIPIEQFASAIIAIFYTLLILQMAYRAIRRQRHHRARGVRHSDQAERRE